MYQQWRNLVEGGAKYVLTSFFCSHHLNTWLSVFSWRTTLSSTLFHNSPRLSLPTFSTELIFTLLTYAFALSNLARAVVHSLGRYETERAISDSERKAKDERLAFAVTLLCKAAGLYEYIGKECLAEWDKERERVLSLGMSCPRPPALSREVVIGLSKYVSVRDPCILLLGFSFRETMLICNIPVQDGARGCAEPRHPQTPLQGRLREYAHARAAPPQVTSLPRAGGEATP